MWLGDSAGFELLHHVVELPFGSTGFLHDADVPRSGSTGTRSTRRSTSRRTRTASPTRWSARPPAARRDRGGGLLDGGARLPVDVGGLRRSARSPRGGRPARGARLAAAVRRRTAATERGPGRGDDLRQRPLCRAGFRRGDRRDRSAASASGRPTSSSTTGCAPTANACSAGSSTSSGGAPDGRGAETRTRASSGSAAVAGRRATSGSRSSRSRGPGRSWTPSRPMTSGCRSSAGRSEPGRGQGGDRGRARYGCADVAAEGPGGGPAPAPDGQEGRRLQGLPKDEEPRPRAARKSPTEPRWLRDLDPADRRRATTLDRPPDRGRRGRSRRHGPARPRRRGSGGRGFAVEQAIRALGPKPSVAEVADLLSDGRDDGLGVRWRLVDGDGRPIPLDTDALERS